MGERKCLAAWTPSDASYPPYVNISAEGDDVIITLRAAKNEDGSCGQTVSVPMPRDCFKLLMDEVRERDFDWGALQSLRKASP